MFKKDEEQLNDGEIRGYIGKGMVVEGRLTFEGAARIDGKFKGEISSSGALHIGEGATIEADIIVDTVVITGEIKGKIEASSRVELRAPGKMLGDIKTPNLIIGEGVVFDGNCVMTKRSGDQGKSALKAATRPVQQQPSNHPAQQSGAQRLQAQKSPSQGTGTGTMGGGPKADI